MALYRLRYTFNVDVVGQGVGPMGAVSAVLSNAGSAQTKGFINTPGGQNILGTGSSGVIAASDITTLTTNAGSDMSTQLNASIATLQGFASGQP